MVHCDVKSANVLLQRNDERSVVRAVLADFGLARFHSDLNVSGSRFGLAASSMTALVGTHGYVDPLCAEVLYIFNLFQLMQCLLIIFQLPL
jgi:serine/threonine protein kinase